MKIDSDFFLENKYQCSFYGNSRIGPKNYTDILLGLPISGLLTTVLFSISIFQVNIDVAKRTVVKKIKLTPIHYSYSF